jgi:NAD(P)-dependent dehydrogenase (short-subunit alcohol dehydrogenase family)
VNRNTGNPQSLIRINPSDDPVGGRWFGLGCKSIKTAGGIYMKRLEGKVAIITGGNSGVGAATAKKLAGEGASVVITARRAAALEEVADEIRAAGGNVLAVPTDISKEDAVENMVQATLEAYGKIDILVNNAGILEEGLKPIDRFSDEDLDRIVDTNMKGTMRCMRAVLPKMQSGASVVNVASVAGVIGNGGAAYVASKAGIVGITRHTALRFQAQNIRCNAVCPGTIVTPMVADMKAENLDPDMMGSMAAHSNMKTQPCMPQDVANIILFLASDESRAITGQALVTDFGSTL